MPHLNKPGVLHKCLAAAVDLFNRNPWSNSRLEFFPRFEPRFHTEDGLWTYHAHDFIDHARFRRAYDRAVQAGGWDYGIRWRVHTILWAAQHGARLDGAFVECGTGRGFMASAICEYLDWGGRPFYLFDTFLSGRVKEDGTQNGDASPFYADGPGAPRANFSEWDGVELVVGWVPESLRETGPVAFLHVDMNHAASEEAAVNFFWPRLVHGAVVVFDDYGHVGYEKQRDIADRLGGELGFAVLTLPTGQGVALKP